jgi:hypothetical protein
MLHPRRKRSGLALTVSSVFISPTRWGGLIDLGDVDEVPE